MTTVVLSSTLTQYTKNQSKLDIAGKTLFAVLINLIQSYPQLRTHLFDVQGELTKNMNFYLNEETITAKYWQNIPIRKDDIISILLAGRSGQPSVEAGNHEHIQQRPPRNDRRDRLRLVYSAKPHQEKTT